MQTEKEVECCAFISVFRPQDSIVFLPQDHHYHHHHISIVFFPPPPPPPSTTTAFLLKRGNVHCQPICLRVCTLYYLYFEVLIRHLYYFIAQRIHKCYQQMQVQEIVPIVQLCQTLLAFSQEIPYFEVFLLILKSTLPLQNRIEHILAAWHDHLQLIIIYIYVYFNFHFLF